MALKTLQQYPCAIYLILNLLTWTASAKFTEKSISESSVVGSTVFELPSFVDDNLGYILYEYGDPAAFKHFIITPNGEIKLKSRLKFELGKINTIFIVAVLRNKALRYGGTAHTVKVIIEDTNDNSPTFEKSIYYGHIEEGMAADTVVSGLEDCFATDQDSSGIVGYTIVEGNNNNEFRVDSSKRGDIDLLVLRTNKRLDRDEMRLTPYLDLLLRVNDGGEGDAQKFETTVIRVTIKDRNDNSPVFLHVKWQNTVQENAQIMTSVMKVSASDNDEGQNSEIYYHFKETNDEFVINPATGVISVAAPLNEDVKNIYRMVVIAQDKAIQNPLTAEAYIKIQVLNVPKYPPSTVYGGRNSPPKFPKTKHLVTVRRDVPLMSTIFFVPAADSDPYGPLSKLQYSLSGVHEDMFHISSKSGVVTLSKSLKRLALKTVKLTVSVQDGAGERASMEVEIKIQTLDTNLHNPFFFPSTVSLSIPQSITKNSEIGFTARATDNDGSNTDDGKVTYNIIDGTGIGRFLVGKNSGKITTSIFFKEPRIYNLYIRAQDHGKYRRTGMLYVQIRVVASVNIAPLMSRVLYKAKVQENLPANTFVAAVFAENLTSRKLAVYQLRNSRDIGSLAVDTKTGVITTTMPLSYEKSQSLMMEVSASIEGQTESSIALVSVEVININNNPPVFTRSSLTVNVAENSGHIPSLVCLFAIDKDGGDVSYSIESGNTGNVFSIGKDTGRLSVKNLDYETLDKYKLVVTATDGKQLAEATVNVNVVDTNDPPHFDRSVFLADLNENSAENTLVQTLGVTSETSGSHLCEWGTNGVTPRVLSLFTLTTELRSCVIKVKTSNSIKWSRENLEYEFEIKAINRKNVNEQSTAMLKVKIRDTNDNKPIFTQQSYVVSMQGGSQISQSILQVSAHDSDDGSNGKISYDLEESADSNMFALKPSGDIFVKSALTEGREYSLTVNARDKGSPNSWKTSVQISISVHPPSNQALSLGDGMASKEVAENFAVNSKITSFAVVNGASIEYSIVGGNLDGIFSLTQQNGELMLVKPLDAEKASSHPLIVRATERSTPPKYVEKLFTVKVGDENDNSPVFVVDQPNQEKKIYIDRFSPEGTIIQRVKAVDADQNANGLVRYSIDGTAPVSISNDGVVSINADIQDAIGREFKYTIVASDSNTRNVKSAQLKVIAKVKAGTKPPVFNPATFTATLDDNTVIGTELLTITTTENDPSSTTTFEVLSKDLVDHFCIDHNKVLYVQKSIDVDTLKKSQLDLKIQMTHGYQTSLATVKVSLTNENDNLPVFEQTSMKEIPVQEASTIGSLIYTVKAIDLDGGANGQIKYSITNTISTGKNDNPFRMDPDTGQITLKKKLNYEAAGEYFLTVKAEDQAPMKHYSLMEIKIVVKDVNDELPSFSETIYSEVISLTQKPGQSLLHVFASDLDSGLNGIVKYQIVNGDYDGTFSIDSSTGIITLQKPIALLQDKNGKQIETFTLNIKAKDSGSVALSGQAIVQLRAVIKEGPPKFALPKFVFNTKENEDPLRSLGRATAVSVDELTYTIHKGNMDGLFKIDSKTGTIYPTSSLDAEENTKYLIYVRTTDLSERFAESSVEINVQNVNDNLPKFRNAVNSLIEAIVPRDSPVNTIIVKIDGYDSDIGDRVKYNIIGSARKYFQIGPNNGVIRSVKSLGELAVGTNQYTFQIQALDTGNFESTAQVRVLLVKKLPGEEIRSVTESVSLTESSIIRKVGGRYINSVFKIIYPDENPFLVDQSSGNLRIRSKLDYESIKEYTIFIEEANTDDVSDYVTYEVRIQVTDENDNNPIFTMKDLIGKVNRNAQLGTTVLHISVKDEDSGDAGTIDLQLEPDTIPFSIDPFTSEIKTSSWEINQEWYNVTIKATDRGKPRRTTRQNIYIKTGENPPQFEKDVYHFVARENAEPGDFIGKVSARSLSGIPVRYDIESGNQKNLFTIDSQGSITLQGRLDYESGSALFDLIILAKEHSKSPLESRVSCAIQVTNENDNPPEFTTFSYRPPQPISESLGIGSTILTVTATDKDCGEFGKCAGGLLTYSINKYKDIFKIDPITGAITNIGKLDYETHKDYRFQVEVFDNGDSPLKGVTDVVIPIKNANDNPPIFKPKMADLSMAESIKSGTVIFTVQASDPDNDELNYSIESGSDSNFEIGPKTGVVQITTKGTPSFTQHQYLLNITAYDGLYKDYFALKINIDDVNDNSPVFEDCAKYKPSVLEQASVGAYVIKVTATDGDRGRNGEMEYELQEPQQEQGALVEPAFRIDNTTGEISTNRIFNREQKSSYIVLVIALDGGHGRSTAERNSASCQLEIKIEDINDHIPVFSNPRYDISISEDTSIDQVVIEVSAQDADDGTNAQIIYSIKQASLTPEFKIDSTTGAISVAQSLIGKNQDWYKFQVEARDKGARPNFASIEIDINVRSSNPPRFKQSSYKTRLSEDVGAGSEVLTVEATTQNAKDAGKVYYSLLPGNFPSTNKPKTFTIDPETGVIKTSRLLDYEKLKKYDLTVSAKDERGMKSHVKVKIEILDVNDNSPIFITNYEFGKVSENKAPGQIVEQVNATDLDSGKFGQVTYSLLNSTEGKMFTIDPYTGVIKTKVRFDREQTPRVTFNVRATDGADPPLDNSVAVTVQITDVNDSPPVFLYKQYNKTVMEDVKIGSNVLEIEATDKDAGENARLNYYIVSGNDKGYFGTRSIHRTDGKSIGFVTVEKELDREETQTFVLKIAASDYKYDDTTTVTINVKDINDNNPRFLKLLYNATVPENSAPGLYVTTVSAVDADSAETQQPITYHLAKEATGYFFIDQNKGIITTGPVPFDREEKPVYKFLVFATDGIRFGQSTIKVNVLDRNDEAPVFMDGPYIRKVEENKEPGKAVGYVLAKDRDEKDNAMITYSLRRHTDRFMIEPNTGLIRTKVKLDRESNDNHFKVVVRATDHGKPPLHGEAEVTILVDDANDQYPYFEKDVTRVQVPECYDIGDTVTTVVARDNDLGKNAELFYAIARGNSPRHFRIDNKKGTITVARSLDFETEKKRFELFISVRDGGYIELISKKNASVIIDIQDCNDNAPRFSQATYKANISEGANIGTLVIGVSAQDADSGINKEFDFFIVNPDENYQFTIRPDETNRQIGIVTLAWKLDRETLSEHIIQIGARDRGDAPKTGYAQLTVVVNDINDNPPFFRPPDFCGFVQEELTGSQQLVTTVHISDPDDPVKNQCPCTFELLDPYGLFTIDYNKADSYKAFVKTKPNAKFDRDVKDQQLYKIKVKAIDRGGLESTTNVYVEVGDKNDNKAASGGQMTFDVLSYNGKIKNADVGRVLIIDNDRGLNHTYQHRLEPKSDNFAINEYGVVMVTKRGADEGNYRFKVVSKDTSGKEVTSSIKINLANIPDDVVQNGFPLRIRGLRKPLTCNEIKYVDFTSILSKVLSVDVSQVVVFSVQEARSVYRGVDIWFTILQKIGANAGFDDVEYMPYMELLTKISEKREELERETGGEVLSIGIDACSKETCRDGFCSNIIQGSSKYTTVSNENGIIPAQKSAKSLVTFDVQVLSRCSKQPKGPELCTSLNSKACLNGGTCVQLGSNGYRCKCRSGFDGPQCQVTTRHIKDNGYFWLDTLSFFYEGSIEFEFSTQRQSGLLLYHGPVTKWSESDISDFLAIDLDNGQLRISVSQGERKVFQKTLQSVHTTLADGEFHHVLIYKREKFIKVVLDRCRNAAIEESWDKPSIRDRSKCELTGTIPGRWKFINGIYPLQVGGVRDYTLGYPNRDINDRTHRFVPFKGCIRNIIDNGRMYDLRFPLLNYNTDIGCSLFVNMFCPSCYNGVCDMSVLNLVTKSYACQCYHGWMGNNCDERVEAYSYMANSYSKYTIMKKPTTWYDRYVTHYMVQVRTKGDGVILHEEGSKFQKRFEFSTLEIIDHRLHYHFNLGDGNKTLVLSNANITDGRWHNITVHRVGNQATLEMMSNNEIVGRVTGSKGRHQLLDTSGVLYVGGNLYKINGEVEVVDNFKGCIAHNTYQGNYLDRKIGPGNHGNTEQESKYVDISRHNAYKNCSCDTGAAAGLCLNGGVCVAGSPPYCLCYFGWSGLFCGIKPGDAPLGAPPALGSNGMMILVVLVLAFLLVLVLVALAVTNLSKKNKAIPIYVDGNGRENIMPYNNEGAGEDDFENYDLEKLLMHTGGRDLIFMDEYKDEADAIARANAANKSAMASSSGTASSNIAVSGAEGSGFAGAASALFGASTKSQFIQKDEEKEHLLQAETAVQTENIETTFTSSFKESESAARARFNRNRADDIDVAAFIQANLTDADNDDAYHPKDTLLHYGYGGQDSDVEDLSDLDFDPDDHEEDDFTFLRQFGAQFYEINILYNPEDYYEEEEV